LGQTRAIYKKVWHSILGETRGFESSGVSCCLGRAGSPVTSTRRYIRERNSLLLIIWSTGLAVDSCHMTSP
jgi:hypothetical protein